VLAGGRRPGPGARFGTSPHRERFRPTSKRCRARKSQRPVPAARLHRQDPWPGARHERGGGCRADQPAVLGATVGQPHAGRARDAAFL